MGRRQQSESIEVALDMTLAVGKSIKVALDMEKGGLVNHFDIGRCHCL